MNEEIDVWGFELIDTFEKFSLYYHREDASIWIYNGEKYHGVDMNVLTDFLLRG
jgi:hypothetical protein